MATISDTHRLYLYQLFIREIGAGKQTPLARMEEVFMADGLAPQDLDHEDMRSLLEDLGDFVRLTVFKRGRVYATVLAQPAWDELLAASTEPAEKQQTTRGKRSWKRKKGAKALRPVKPRHRETTKDDVVVEGLMPETDVKLTREAEPTKKLESAKETSIPAQTDTETNEASLLEATTDPAETIQPEEAGSHPTTGDAPDAEEAPTPYSEQNEGAKGQEDLQAEPPSSADGPSQQVEPEDTEPPQGAMPAPNEGRISLTVTYDPYADDKPDDAAVGIEAKQEPVPVDAYGKQYPSRHDVAQQTKGSGKRKASQPNLPHNFADEVLCDNEHLGLLYSVLPLDVEPFAMLDEDWRVARSTESYTVNDGGITFELRYVDAEGKPLRVTIRRMPQTRSGKRWHVTQIEGSEIDAAQVSLYGLERQGTTSWPLFAQFAHLNQEERMLRQLAALAQPEPWGKDLVGLKTYLALAFRRAEREGTIAVTPDGREASFDTGLLDRREHPIYLRLSPSEDDIPWICVGFEVRD